ncbi:MAG: TolC family protein [Pseudomonadota bacterium]
MFGVPFTRGRSRAAFLRADGLIVACGLIFSGCAGATGSASSRGSRAAYDGSVIPIPAHTAVDSAVDARHAVLERHTYVRSVLAHNPSIESARQGWRAALARVRQTGSFEDPMLDLGLAPLSIGSSKAPLGYEVGISQRLPWFGKRDLESSAAAAEANASKSDFEALKRELALSALLLYDQYFIAVRSIEINRQHVELMRAMRDAATAQFQAGRASAQDPLQAEAELAHMEHDTLVLASQRDVTVAQMNELLHRAPELPLPPPVAELPLPALPNVSNAPQLETDAVAQRSEISAARERARAAQARAERADRESYPDVTLSTSYNSMWDMPEHRWMVGLGFNLPLQTGRRAGSADEAEALRAGFESDAVRLSDAARTQVFVALQQLRESAHVLDLFELRLLPVAKDQIDAARAGFTASQNPFMAVVAAEKNLRSVELDYQVARADCDRHRAELDRALGRIPGLDGQGERP